MAGLDEDNPSRRALPAPRQIGSWSWDLATGDVQWGAGLREILGMPDAVRPELARYEALVHEIDRPVRQAALSTAMSATPPQDYHVEYRIRRHRDGEIRWVSSSGTIRTDEHGTPLRIEGLLCDITDWRRSTEEIRRSEARLAGILSIAADAIVVVDAGQRIQLFNQGAEQIFGFTRDDVIGQPLDILLPEPFRSGHAALVRRFGEARGGSRRMGERGEITGRRKSGETFAAEASISHLEMAGEMTFTVVLRDISERKKAEAMLARSNAELEKRVAERTEELRAEMQRREAAKAQLLRTQRMEAFGQLTGGVAHDFNNLLTVIIGNLELAEMRVGDERIRTLLNRAQEAAEMGARLTSRLLTFARRGQFAPATLNLNEQVMGMVELLQRTLGEPIDLNARLEPRLWNVRADPSEIENAVLNLAINARDAMPGGGRLVVETANMTVEDSCSDVPALRPGDYVCLSVSDSGSGMSAEIMQRAFEPFFTTKEHGKGTGLGLSTIYGFATQLGGTATIASTPDVGTTVNVYLPRYHGTAPVAIGAHAQAGIPVAQGETILLVEDDGEVRQVARARLEALGYTVVEAEDGPAAVRVLETGRAIDAVLSDVVMPGTMSGLDVAKWVRCQRPDVAMLLMSGYPADILEQKGGIVETRLLRKPHTRADLARAVRDVLDGGKPKHPGRDRKA